MYNIYIYTLCIYIYISLLSFCVLHLHVSSLTCLIIRFVGVFVCFLAVCAYLLFLCLVACLSVSLLAVGVGGVALANVVSLLAGSQGHLFVSSSCLFVFLDPVCLANARVKP